MTTRLIFTGSSKNRSLEKLGHWFAGTDLMFDWALVGIEHNEFRSAIDRYNQTFAGHKTGSSSVTTTKAYGEQLLKFNFVLDAHLYRIDDQNCQGNSALNG